MNRVWDSTKRTYKKDFGSIDLEIPVFNERSKDSSQPSLDIPNGDDNPCLYNGDFILDFSYHG